MQDSNPDRGAFCPKRQSRRHESCSNGEWRHKERPRLRHSKLREPYEKCSGQRHSTPSRCAGGPLIAWRCDGLAVEAQSAAPPSEIFHCFYARSAYSQKIGFRPDDLAILFAPRRVGL
jgi:hypothetical protein